MKRSSLMLLVVLALAISISAFGQLADPNIMVGPSGATCPTNCSFDPNGIGATGFTLFSNGKPTADVPWYILLAIPEAVGTTEPGNDPTAPTITGTGFTISAGVDAGDFLRTTSGDIYAFASADDGGLNGDGSLNATNLFCSGNTSPCTTGPEVAAFGSEPGSFDIFVYTVSAGSLTGGTNFQFSSTTLPLGTYVAGLGVGDNGKQPFSTPYTTVGLVDATSTTSVGGSVPEPASIMLFGTFLLATVGLARKKFIRS